MSKVLVLAETGFGKTTSIGNIPEVGIEGLKPEETFVISASGELPFRGWKKDYPFVPTEGPPKEGRFKHSDDMQKIAKTIRYIYKNREEIKNIVLDDQQYLMGNYYVNNSVGGDQYGVFKKIGAFMADLYRAIDEAHRAGLNIIVMSHYEEVGRGVNLSYKPKTAGKMVDTYLTLEGQFQVVLYGKITMEADKTMKRMFVTNADGDYNQAKSPIGMFQQTHIPNDMGYVLNKIKEYYEGN
jgi:hypothetical protein